MTEDSIGIDISKAHLDVHRLGDGQRAQFPNTAKGFKALRNWIGTDLPARIVYEATGPYHGAFERALREHLPLVKVNPLQARRFVQATGTRAKTDRVDAMMLARMGAAFDLQPDQPASEDAPVLKELQIARTALVKDRTRLKNRLQTQTHSLTRRHTKARLAQIERQLQQLDGEIEGLVRACPKRARHFNILNSIPGIAKTTAAAILIEMPEIGSLTNKAAASLAGLAPMTRQSGKWKGQAFIQGGRKFLRDALYMPALVASRYNEEMKRKYRAMKNAGKPAKVAITTIMRKLIILANTLIKDNRMWVKNEA